MQWNYYLFIKRYSNRVDSALQRISMIENVCGFWLLLWNICVYSLFLNIWLILSQVLTSQVIGQTVPKAWCLKAYALLYQPFHHAIEWSDLISWNKIIVDMTSIPQALTHTCRIDLPLSSKCIECIYICKYLSNFIEKVWDLRKTVLHQRRN